MHPTKTHISEMVKRAMAEQGLSYRKAAPLVHLTTAQLHRITSGKNYSLDTLENALKGLGLELQIRKKGDIKIEK